jgi:endogenous inhibitor of DNA gyrase (YacG/DUF329 family)
MKPCEECGGMIVKIGEVTGYAGPWCSCPTKTIDLKVHEWAKPLHQQLEDTIARLESFLRCPYGHPKTILMNFFCNKCGYSESEWRG